MSSPVSESVSCMIGPSVNALLPGFVVIRLLMTGCPSHTDVIAAKSVDLVPDPQPDVKHRTGYFTTMSSAFVVGFDMVLMVRYNADGWVSVLEDCGYCFELGPWCRLMFPIEWSPESLQDFNGFLGIRLLGCSGFTSASAAIPFGAILDAFVPYVFAVWARAVASLCDLFTCS